MTSQIEPQYKKTALSKVILNHHGKTLFKLMSEWNTQNHVPPVLLLTGQTGIGKHRIAQYLAQWILCDQAGFKNKSLEACESCSSCERIESKNEVNLIEFSSDADEDSEATSKSLKIEQFRNLKSSAGFGAFERQFKIVIIPSADRMTSQAANSVLKLLEEPPVGWVFLLTASDPTLLLPTLLSRCQMVRLKPYSNPEIELLLKESGVDQKKQKLCSELSQGSLSRALAFAEEEIWEKRKLVLQFLENPASAMQALLDWTSQKPRDFDLFLDLLEQYTADLIRWSLSHQQPNSKEYSWSHSDSGQSLSEHAKLILSKFSKFENARENARTYWISRAERISQARVEAQTPINRKILIQDLLVSWIPTLGDHR